MPKELVTSIDIAAPPARVWQVLTDFAAYPAWNPFLREGAGELRVGGLLQLRAVPQGSRGMTIRPRVVRFEPERELRWRGSLPVPGLFTGEHRFVLEPRAGGGVRFVQAEVFTGLLVPFLRKLLDLQTLAGFEAMNEALRARAEAAGAGERRP